MPVWNALRHPAADLKPCGAERVRDGDGYIAAREVQGARWAQRHHQCRDVGKPGADVLPVGGAAETSFTAPGFNPVPDGVIRAGGHHAVLALAQCPGDP